MRKKKTLLQRAKDLVGQINRTHEYSMSAIFGVYNEITGKSETPHACSSCLIRKVDFISSWICTEEKRLAEIQRKEQVEKITQNQENNV